MNTLVDFIVILCASGMASLRIMQWADDRMRIIAQREEPTAKVVRR